MYPKRILLVLACLLLALAPLGCGGGEPATTAAPPSNPTKTARPPRPTLTPAGSNAQPSRPGPTQALPTRTTAAPPTTRPTSDPATTLFERDYGSQSGGFDEAFITQYGTAIVVLAQVQGSLQYQVISLEDGWEAAFTNPLDITLDAGMISVTGDQILIAGYYMMEEGVTLWKVTPGQEAPAAVATLDNPDAWVIDLAFSPDGKTLAVGYSTGDVKLYRTSDGKLQRTIKAHSGWVMSLSYSWDGRYLLTDGESFDPHTYVYNASSGARVATLNSESWNPEAPSFSADGSRVTAISDGGMIVYSTSNWQPVSDLLGTWGATLSCQGTSLWMNMIGQVQVYSYETGELLATLDYGPIYCLADGRAAVVDGDAPAGTLRLRLLTP